MEYTHVFDYCYDAGDGERYPVLPLELVNVTNAALRTQTRGYLDTGCSRSLFDGRLGLSESTPLGEGASHTRAPPVRV